MSKSRVTPRRPAANVPDPPTPTIPGVTRDRLRELLAIVADRASRACHVTSAARRFIGGEEGGLSDDDDVRVTLCAALEQINGELTNLYGAAQEARTAGGAA